MVESTTGDYFVPAWEGLRASAVDRWYHPPFASRTVYCIVNLSDCLFGDPVVAEDRGRIWQELTEPFEHRYLGPARR